MATSRKQTLEQFVHYDFMANVAAFDGGIAAWNEKYRHDAVRPFSAIRFLYGDSRITAWGGPGKGTVNDITGKEWRSYLPTADHPEYPSGSACFCAAHAQASRRYLGSDALGWQVRAPQGSSVIEPGVTPAKDITLSFDTWTSFENECALSRVHGGVHFRAAVQAGAKLCKPMGDLAFEFVDSHIKGTPKK